MKLDRNINPDGTGKYALILQRKDPIIGSVDVQQKEGMVDCLCVRKTAVDFGSTPDTEFFVIRMKDKYAAAALKAYAHAAQLDDPEWADEVWAMAKRAEAHPNQQKPN